MANEATAIAEVDDGGLSHGHLPWLARMGLATSVVILLGCVSVLFATRQSASTAGVLPGQPVIDVDLVGPDGTPSSLSDLRGNVVLMVFNGATNTAVGDEAAFLSAFRDRRDVRVVSVGNDKLASMLTGLPLSLGDASLADMFAVEAGAHSTYFVIDQAGAVRYRSDGVPSVVDPGDRRRAIELVDRLLLSSGHPATQPAAIVDASDDIAQ